MKFIFEFVSCYGTHTSRAAEVRAEDEERWLVPPPSAASSSRHVCRKKQRKTGPQDWRPSLGSISEDYAVLPRDRSNHRNDAVGSVGRDVKKRNKGVPVTGAGGGNVKVQHRGYSDSDGYRGSASVPTIIMPTFSPTPFMF